MSEYGSRRIIIIKVYESLSSLHLVFAMVFLYISMVMVRTQTSLYIHMCLLRGIPCNRTTVVGVSTIEDPCIVSCLLW